VLRKSRESSLCGYEQLSIAVVRRAAIDYEWALRRLLRNPHDIRALKMQNDCERFFQNEIELFTTVDGTMLMKRIQDNARKGQKVIG